MSKRLVVVLGVLTSLGLLALVLAQLDLSAALIRLRGIDLGGLTLALGAALVVLLARGLRFWALTTRSGVAQVVAAIAVQNFLTRVTPLRLGELSLPYTLKRVADEPAAEALVALALVRLVEIWVLGMFALGGAVIVFGGEEALGPLWWTLGLSSALLLTFRFWASLAVRALAWGLARVGLDQIEKIRRPLHKLSAAVEEGARYGRRAWAALLGGTVAVMSAQLLLFGALISACGVEVSPAQLVVGVSGAAIASALPLLTVGSVGTLEAGWAAAFVWVGLGLEEAVLTGVVAQVLTLLFAALFAAPASWWLGRRSGQ